MFIHELFQDKADGKSKNHDVCLLKSNEDIFAAGKLNNCGNGCMNAACIPEADAVHNSTCWVAGWGAISHGGSSSSILKEAAQIH